jgi:hypothetical protein
MPDAGRTVCIASAAKPDRRARPSLISGTGLTLDRYGHLYGSDVEAVGVAINDLLTRNCGHSVGTRAGSSPTLRVVDGR